MGTDILSSTERREEEGRKKREQIIVEQDAGQRARGREQEAYLTSQKNPSRLGVNVWGESTVACDAAAVPMGYRQERRR